MRSIKLGTRWIAGIAIILLFCAQYLAAAKKNSSLQLTCMQNHLGTKIPEGKLVVSNGAPSFKGSTNSRTGRPAVSGALMAIITGIVRGVAIDRGGKIIQGGVRTHLFEGDVLLTGPSEKCVILLSDNSEIKLNENTRLVLNRAIIPKIKQKKTILTILFGEIFANISKGRKQELEVRAGRAVAAIEGTQLACRWPKGSPTASLFVVSGKVRYYGIDSPVRDVGYHFNNSKSRYDGVNSSRPVWRMVSTNHRCDYQQSKPPATALMQPIIVPDMRGEVRWSENIKKYVQTITEAITLSQQLLQATQAAGGLMPAALTEKLNETISEFDQIQHDSSFHSGHQAIYTALINFRRCAAISDQSFCATASAYYTNGITAFAQYQQEYAASMQAFQGNTIQENMQGNMAGCGKECNTDADCTDPGGATACPKCIDTRVRYGDPWKKKCLTAEWAAQHNSWLCLDDCYRKYTKCLTENWDAYTACVEAAGNTYIKGDQLNFQAYNKANDECKSRRDRGIDACERTRRACEANCPPVENNNK